MSLRFDILSVRASVTGYYAIACLYFPSGLSSSGSATITPDSGSAQAIADGASAIYLLLAESGSTTLHSKGAAISALPDTSALPFTVEVREVASNPTNTQAGLATAFSGGSTIAQRQPCEGSMQGGWVKSGAWLLAPYLDSAVSDAGGSQGSAVTVYTSVNYAGSTPDDETLPITLYKGRKATIGPLTFADYAGDIEDNDSVLLRIIDKAVYEDTSDPTIVALVESTATASLVDGTLTLQWDLTADDTNNLPAGADGSGQTVYRMIAGCTDDQYPIVDRECVVKRYPATPA